MLRAPVLLSLLLLTAFVSAVRAEIRVVDAETGAQRTLMRGETFFDGDSGPHGWTLRADPKADDQIYELRAPDGRLVRSFHFDNRIDTASIAWAQDGSRLAITLDPELVVFDTATGAELMRRDVGALRLTAQPFAPDASAVLMSSYDDRLVRVDLPSGRMTSLARGWDAAWSSTGRVALVTRKGVRVLGRPDLRVPVKRAGWALWKPDGETLAVGFTVGGGKCAASRDGIAVAVPGGSSRVLVRPRVQEVYSVEWSPDGRTLAVEYGPSDAQQRGVKRKWPRRIARDYSMFSRRGDRAVRKVVVRATRLLRRGAGREKTMSFVRHRLTRVADRYPELYDTDAGDAIADEISRWLTAAGLEPIEARDELTC